MASNPRQVHVNPEILPKVLDILELIVHSEETKVGKKVKDIYSMTFAAPDRPRSRSMGRECIELVNQCISNHRYKEAVKLLWLLCHDTNVFDPFIFKAALVIFNNLELNNQDEILWKLFCALQNLKDINKREVQLEYAMYCLKNDKQDSVRSFEELTLLKMKSHLRKNDRLDPIFEAYSSLLEYVEWHKQYYDDMMQSQSQTLSGRVTIAFEKLIDTPGDWDIFILKLVYMMEACDQQEVIEPVLLKYVNRNPHNINAYIYLCVYLYYHNPRSENLVKHLEILADMCPSDARVLWLLEIWFKQGKEFKICVEYIFMFLDYPSNGKNISAWKILWHYLSEALLSKKKLKVAKSLWESRSRSWKWLYFNTSQVSQLGVNDSLLIAFRVAVLSFFEAEHIFIKDVLKKFPIVTELMDSIKEIKPSHQKLLS